MRVLRARLYEIEKERIHQERAKDRKAADRDGRPRRKIRTYNFPQNRMTDHRIGLTKHQLAQVMEGQLQPTIDALIAHYHGREAEGGDGRRDRRRLVFIRFSSTLYAIARIEWGTVCVG